MGLLLVGSLSGGSMAKGVFAGALGILLGSVGLDPLTAEERFYLWLHGSDDGYFSAIAIMIGMFGVSEALDQMHYLSMPAIKQRLTRIVPSWQDVKKHLPLGLRCSALGTFIGALPRHRGRYCCFNGL